MGVQEEILKQTLQVLVTQVDSFDEKLGDLSVKLRSMNNLKTEVDGIKDDVHDMQINVAKLSGMLERTDIKVHVDASSSTSIEADKVETIEQETHIRGPEKR